MVHPPGPADPRAPVDPVSPVGPVGPTGAPLEADTPGPLRVAFQGLTTRGRSFLAAGGAAAGCAYLLGQPDLLRVGVLLAVLPLVCVLVLHRTRARVTAARRLSPARVPAGGDARVHLLVENVHRLPSGVLQLQDQVPFVLGQRPRFVLDRIEPGGRREVSYRVRSDHRGRYPLGPLQLRLADPFGMVELSRSFEARDTMTVLPAIEPLPALPLSGDTSGFGAGRRRALSLAGEDDVIPRSYRHGDDVRRVHWRSTARHGTLMVRREEQPHRAHCTVLLDTRRCGYLDAGPGSGFERAVSGAASVVTHLSERGYPVRLLTDTGAELPGAPAEQGDPAELAGLIMDTLAVVEHSAGTSLQPAAAALRADGGGLVLAFLGAVDEEQVAVLGGVRQRASGAVAFLTAGQLDPAVESARRRALRAAGWTALGHFPDAPLPVLWQQALTGLATAGERR